ncbi:3'(2'),5'-bisphosphate nucleotidase CysQ [Halomonas sp. NO4]|uniref:3'(2'),5'-bisphosphate nucleotidase CysQ n=1 Tax=Halomonas sp. NO4 TaxID=2484813 RepID=UPI001F09AB38|nr:3'(2'),5'-bisphosphate nucleotidase CysQ [Halomonas sp. NO4]
MTGYVTDDQLQCLIEGVQTAGREVRAIQTRGFAVQTKADDSPLTEADMAAHRALLSLLQEVAPELPVLSEESGEIPWKIRRKWSRYWLVDPLDGTKEFVSGSDEFTLNAALVETGVPVLGIVHAPALDGGAGTTWVGEAGQGAFTLRAGMREAIHVRPLPDPAAQPWRVLGSRRHGLERLQAFRDALPAHTCDAVGSSLKFCRIAEGAADLHARFGPTSEWDTAAAQAVVTAAGGQVLDAHTLEPLRYNQRESLENPDFVVCTERDARWERALRTAMPS